VSSVEVGLDANHKGELAMSLTTWRKRNSDLATRNELEDFLSHFMEPLDWNFRSRLPATFQQEHVPSMNVAETEKDYLVSLELPGLEPKDVELALMGNQLTISGERKWEEEKKGKEYHRVESQYGRFARTLTLPPGLRLERESIEAGFDKGVLHVRIPKLEPTKAEKIPVKAR
jgi:HSP20 family protein